MFYRVARHRLAVPAIAAMAALAISLQGISGPSFWLDEAATISMAERPLPDLMRALDNLDLVHATYYLLMKPWIGWFGTGELALRAPSALATMAAAAGVASLGRRCASARAGLVSGLVYASAVTVTRYAQEARPYAMVTAAAVLATYLFVRAVQAPDRQWPWLVAYALSVVLVGLLSLFALLLVVAHGVTLLWGRLSGLARGRDVLGWCVSAVVSVALLAQFVIAAQSQKAQVASIKPPTMDAVWRFLCFMAGHEDLILIMTVLMGIGVVAGGKRARSPREAPDTRPAPTLTMVAMPWLFLPPVILIVASISTPMFRPRYEVFCLPALALLVGAALALLWDVRLPLLAAGVAVLLLPTVPAQLDIREQDERIDDLRAAATLIRQNARSGDPVVYMTPYMRWRAAAYADAYTGLRDVMLDTTPNEAGNLVGVDTTLDLLKSRLCRASRVWVMWDAQARKPLPGWVMSREITIERTGPYVRGGEWSYKGGKLTLLKKAQGPPRCRV